MSSSFQSCTESSIGDALCPVESSNATSQNVPDCPAAASENRDPKSASDGPAELSERQLAALELILSGDSDSAVAQAISVNRRTIYRWRREDSAFGAELQRRRQELYARETDRMRSMLGEALTTLHRQVKNTYAPTAHRAARTLLSLSRMGIAVACADPDASRRAKRVGEKQCAAPGASHSTESENGVES
jgi:hypothetical protein